MHDFLDTQHALCHIPSMGSKSDQTSCLSSMQCLSSGQWNAGILGWAHYTWAQLSPTIVNHLSLWDVTRGAKNWCDVGKVWKCRQCRCTGVGKCRCEKLSLRDILAGSLQKGLEQLSLFDQSPGSFIWLSNLKLRRWRPRRTWHSRQGLRFASAPSCPWYRFTTFWRGWRWPPQPPLS